MNIGKHLHPFRHQVYAAAKALAHTEMEPEVSEGKITRARAALWAAIATWEKERSRYIRDKRRAPSATTQGEAHGQG